MGGLIHSNLISFVKVFQRCKVSQGHSRVTNAKTFGDLRGAGEESPQNHFPLLKQVCSMGKLGGGGGGVCQAKKNMAMTAS